VGEGIMSSPNPKSGKDLNKFAAEILKRFYNNDKVSRIMSGEKNYISVEISVVRIHEQKRLCSLKKLYCHFKNSCPGVKVDFVKSEFLHPRNCIMAGASGAQCMSVCTVHQNVKLMLEACKISELTKAVRNNFQCTNTVSQL
jgi:hypothetical protein